MIRPLFKWFGSKWSLAKYLPSPRFDHVIEPYAGGAGYSLRKGAVNVTLIEKHEPLIKLWRWLIQDATEQTIRDIPIDLPVGYDIRKLDMSLGQTLLLKHWQRTNNLSQCWTVSPWGSKPGQWTANTRARVAEEHQHVRTWKILSACAIPVEQDSTIFIDPPYQYNYRYGFGPMDYSNLAEQVRFIQQNTRSQIIACEGVCPKTGAIPDYLPFRPLRTAVNSRRKHSQELVYTA